MKTIKIRILLAFLFFFSAFFSHAVDIEAVKSNALMERLLSYSMPQAPDIFEDLVIFTASSSLRRVGIIFAGEDFSKVQWFRQLLVSADPKEMLENTSDSFKDSGISFYLHQIPQNASSVEYRLIINGLWTTDPANPNTRTDSSGIQWSVFSLPYREIIPHPLGGPSGTLSFSFKGPPGETVTVAGSFNGWDPFMYELKEYPAGNYFINIPMPPGKYQYVFFHRGERRLDPYNSIRVYAKDGSAANEIVVK